jgi:TatD DNase family protein
VIDSHAHIDAKAFDADRADVMQRAWEQGLTHIVVPDIEPQRREPLIQLVDSDPRLSRGIGVHPHHVAGLPESEWEVIEQGASHSRVVAIGEIGLDYYYDFAPQDTQITWFREQIRIAKRTQLPVIVHNREADDDVLQVIEEEQDGSLRGVLHCFSSDVRVLERAIHLGFLVSFTGNITFKRSALPEVVQAVPENGFMIETDSPYITPEPHRGKRNEPAHVALVAQKIAEIRGTTMERIVQITTQTTRAFFGLLSLLLVATVAGVAQPTPPRDEDYPDDREWEVALDNYYADSVAYEKWIKPRKVGVGISFGTNTVVELQEYLQRYSTGGKNPSDPGQWVYYERGAGPSRTSSFNGLAAYGGTVAVGVFTRLVLEGTFLFSENTGPAEDFGLDPIRYLVGEATALYSLNPYSRLNFVPQIGLVYASIDDGKFVRQKFGLNAGIGLGLNIPTSIGLFYPVFNVRFNFLFGTDENRVVQKYTDEAGNQWVNSSNPNIKSEDLADVGTILSIPRFTLLYYFPF